MKNKNSVRGLVILGIVLAAWLVIVLAVPFVKNGVYWLSFVFTLIAFLAQLYIFKISFRNGESVRSKFYGFPIARLGVVYLAVQLVLGLLVMALAKWVPIWVGVILFAVTLAVNQCDAPDLRAALQKLAEDFRFSDPVSSDALADVEASLSACLDELQRSLTDGDLDSAAVLCRRAAATLTERNRLCKLNK